MKKYAIALVLALGFFLMGIPAALGAEGPKVTAKSSLLMDAASGEILVESQADTRAPIASMCKIMTMLLTFEEMDRGALDPDTEIFVSEHASGMGGSQAFLEANDSYPLGELLKAVAVASANDGAVAIAEHIAGSEEAFTEKMNERAKELGMLNTRFANATGLPKPMQYSCARDVAIMTRELIGHPDYFRYSGIWLDKITHKKGNETELANTNKLIRYYNGCDGGKTGYTSEAKHCISATAEREGTRYIAVVIGADSSQSRFDGARALLNYGFANYESRTVLGAETVSGKTVNVLGGKQKTAKIGLREEYKVLMQKGKPSDAEVELQIPEGVKAPVREGDAVGKAIVRRGGKVVFETDVIVCETVEKSGFSDHLDDILENW